MIPPSSHFFLVVVCFLLESLNCTVVNSLGMMGFVILLISISETIFPLTVGKPVCCQLLHSPIRIGALAETMKSPLAAGALPETVHINISRKAVRTLHVLLYRRCSCFLSAAVFFPGLIVSINMFSFLWGVSEFRTTTAAEPKSCDSKRKGSFC